MGTDRRWSVIGVSLSVLLNVFLVGIVAGHMFADRGHRLAIGGRWPVVSHANVRALAPDERRQFASVMVSHRGELQTARKATRAARRVVETDIAAPTFDRARTAADFAALRTANAALQGAVHAALIDAVAGLSPQSRAALVTR